MKDKSRGVEQSKNRLGKASYHHTVLTPVKRGGKKGRDGRKSLRLQHSPQKAAKANGVSPGKGCLGKASWAGQRWASTLPPSGVFFTSGWGGLGKREDSLASA